MKHGPLTAQGAADVAESGDLASGWWVLTVDQVHSRRHADAVPQAEAALSRRCPAMRLPFERTVGDELQGLTADAATVVDAVSELTRLGGWRIGLGLGSVELPLPQHSREARGPAFVAAREAIGHARRQSTRIALVVSADDDATAQVTPRTRGFERTSGLSLAAGRDSRGTVSALPYGEDNDDALPRLARRAESALIVLRALLARRTPEGWQAMQLLDTGLSHREVAERLAISESAVSQRIARAQRDEVARAQELSAGLLEDLRAALPGARDAGGADPDRGRRP